jgi:hypothetical protein
MAWVLLGVLFSLIAAVLLLPRVPAIRRMAGVDGESLPPAREDYVLVPSQFSWPEEEEAPPSRILTANYRDRWVRPIAMTSDTATPWLPPSYRSVSVIHEQDEEVEEALERYGPKQVKLYFSKEKQKEEEAVQREPEAGPLDAEEVQGSAEVVGPPRPIPTPTNPEKWAEVARHGLAVGDGCLALANAYGIRDHGPTGSLSEIPAPARG